MMEKGFGATLMQLELQGVGAQQADMTEAELLAYVFPEHPGRTDHCPDPDVLNRMKSLSDSDFKNLVEIVARSGFTFKTSHLVCYIRDKTNYPANLERAKSALNAVYLECLRVGARDFESSLYYIAIDKDLPQEIQKMADELRMEL